MAVFHQELADKKHQHETGQDNGKAGDEAAQDAPGMRVAGIYNAAIAYVSCAIDTDGTRRTLADGHNIGKLACGQPVVVAHHFALNHGYHGIASSETEQTDEEEGPKQA